MQYLVYIFLGLAPSIIWLLFFLRKDSHPESNPTVLKVFFYGMLSAVPTALVEIGFVEELKKIHLPEAAVNLIYVFIGIALTEEFFKYFVVRRKVLSHPEFDEPIDIMLYMIISALGFAALENLFILLPLANPLRFFESFIVSSFRFVGATFLHALASGLLGYFMALAYSRHENRTKLIATGFLIVVFLHGLYDFSIIRIGNGFKFLLPVIILISLAIFVSISFKKVKKLKSICLHQADK